MAAAQEDFLFDSSASMNGNHHRATRYQGETLGLVKKMAGEMKRRKVTRGSYTLKQVKVEPVGCHRAGDLRCPVLNAAPMRSNHGDTGRRSANYVDFEVPSAHLMCR